MNDYQLNCSYDEFYKSATEKNIQQINTISLYK